MECATLPGYGRDVGRDQRMNALVRALVALIALSAVSAPAADVARYILPPGNYGGIPFTVNSTDQLPLYAGLSPLRDRITSADIDMFFLPEDFMPVGATRV